MNLTNKVAVLTGAGSGIGRALAIQLAKAGCDLAISDINEEGLGETAAMLPANCKVRTDKLDVADKEAFFAYADSVLEEFGRVDLVINNAGVAVAGNTSECDIEHYEWLFGINLWGVLYGTKAFLPGMQQRNSGKVVNISSIFGIAGVPTFSAYNMSKFAVKGLNEVLWAELDGSGVSCLSVHPGGIKTDLVKTARTAGADGEEMAANVSDLFDTSAEECALQIIKAINKGKRRLLVGMDAKLIAFLQRLLPSSYFKITSWYLKSKMGISK